MPQHETDIGIEYLRKQLAQARAGMGKLGGRVEKAERQVRDITKDRDDWRDRAKKAEAALKSIGTGASWSNG